jgi:hypothetical protein
LTNKGYLNFIIGFVMVIGYNVVGIFDAQYTNSGWIWLYLACRLFWFIYLIWLLLTDKPRVPSLLGIAAGILVSIAYSVIWGLPNY